MISGIIFNQGDIVLIPFPYSDLTGSKQRPALIISNEKLNKSQDRICCLITSKFNKEGLIIEDKFIESGKLSFKSWVKPYRIFTIHENIIIKKIAVIKKEFHKKVIEVINEYLKIG